MAALLATSLAGCSTETEEDLAEPTVSLAPTTTTKPTTESSSSTSSTKRKDSPPDCSDEALQASPGFEDFQFFGECEGGFARPGVPQSGLILLAQWDGKHWTEVEADGVWDGMGMARPCFNPGRLEEMGVPKRLAEKEPRCGVYGPGEEPPHKQSTQAAPSTTKTKDPNWGVKRDSDGVIVETNLEGFTRQISAPSCDGRGILILDSVIDEGDVGHTHSQIAFGVAYLGDGNAEFTYPGQCASLRKQVDGQNIYPIYMDFGHDTTALCAAKANYGGNARLLNNSGEYVDPC
ncbi:hypothetical protein [Corynebacterium afermentans]|uniref:hypothetical protein n=1 Tax=Corynebacterium afermentans TaxID=38286 RepID=UPI00257285EF|nr:hypothetical protein [Corynebacterium afermentans]MDC7109156.1 hypothetical protein [Corynebacterium afermentans]